MVGTIKINVLDKKVHLFQPEAGFRTGLDSVMLASACLAGAGDKVLDAGCGVGGALFSLLYRVPDCRLTGVEIEQAYIALAKENISLNRGVGKVDFIHADIRDVAKEKVYCFDHVMCNPPYLESGEHVPSPNAKKAIAMGNQLPDLSLKDWIKAAHRLLKSGGSLTMIHRADKTDSIIQELGRRFGAVEIIPLWPKQGRLAKRVIIRAKKDSKTPTKIHAGLVLHEEDGSYTKEAQEILRNGKGLCPSQS